MNDDEHEQQCDICVFSDHGHTHNMDQFYWGEWWQNLDTLGIPYHPEKNSESTTWGSWGVRVLLLRVGLKLNPKICSNRSLLHFIGNDIEPYRAISMSLSGKTCYGDPSATGGSSFNIAGGHELPWITYLDGLLQRSPTKLEAQVIE